MLTLILLGVVGLDGSDWMMTVVSPQVRERLSVVIFPQIALNYTETRYSLQTKQQIGTDANDLCLSG
jgi:hypothetical protein